MRIAFVGAGGIASNYLSTLEDLPDADVTAICELDEERGREAAEPHDAAVYTDHETLFAEGGFDAVFVCIPPSAHTNQELLAAEHGVDLFVAKPVALTAEKATEVERALADADVVSQAGYMWRYADVVDRAREILDGRAIGLLEGQVWVGVPPTPWWGERERSGGQVVEQATHVYDLVRYLGGEVDRVWAAGEHALDSAVDFEDVTSATLGHADDAPGSVSHVSTTCAAEDGRYDLHVVGEGVRLHLDLLDNSLTGIVDGEDVAYEGDRDGYGRQIEAFLEACRAGDPGRVRSDYADAADTLRLTLAVNEAIASGEQVRPGAA